MPPVDTVKPNGPAIRELRIRHGLTLRQLGKLIGRHGQSIRKLEGDPDALASRVFIHQLARALEVDVSELVLPDRDDANGAAA